MASKDGKSPTDKTPTSTTPGEKEAESPSQPLAQDPAGTAGGDQQPSTSTVTITATTTAPTPRELDESDVPGTSTGRRRGYEEEEKGGKTGHKKDKSKRSSLDSALTKAVNLLSPRRRGEKHEGDGEGREREQEQAAAVRGRASVPQYGDNRRECLVREGPDERPLPVFLSILTAPTPQIYKELSPRRSHSGSPESYRPFPTDHHHQPPTIIEASNLSPGDGDEESAGEEDPVSHLPQPQKQEKSPSAEDHQPNEPPKLPVRESLPLKAKIIEYVRKPRLSFSSTTSSKAAQKYVPAEIHANPAYVSPSTGQAAADPADQAGPSGTSNTTAGQASTAAGTGEKKEDDPETSSPPTHRFRLEPRRPAAGDTYGLDRVLVCRSASGDRRQHILEEKRRWFSMTDEERAEFKRKEFERLEKQLLRGARPGTSDENSSEDAQSSISAFVGQQVAAGGDGLERDEGAAAAAGSHFVIIEPVNAVSSTVSATFDHPQPISILTTTAADTDADVDEALEELPPAADSGTTTYPALDLPLPLSDSFTIRRSPTRSGGARSSAATDEDLSCRSPLSFRAVGSGSGSGTDSTGGGGLAAGGDLVSERKRRRRVLNPNERVITRVMTPVISSTPPPLFVDEDVAESSAALERILQVVAGSSSSDDDSTASSTVPPIGGGAIVRRRQLQMTIPPGFSVARGVVVPPSTLTTTSGEMTSAETADSGGEIPTFEGPLQQLETSEVAGEEMGGIEEEMEDVTTNPPSVVPQFLGSSIPRQISEGQTSAGSESVAAPSSKSDGADDDHPFSPNILSSIGSIDHDDEGGTGNRTVPGNEGNGLPRRDESSLQLGGEFADSEALRQQSFSQRNLPNQSSLQICSPPARPSTAPGELRRAPAPGGHTESQTEKGRTSMGSPLLDRQSSPSDDRKTTPDGSKATPPGCSKATPPGGSKATPPGGSKATPPGGSKAIPPGGSKTTPPSCSMKTPPSGSKSTPSSDGSGSETTKAKRELKMKKGENIDEEDSDHDSAMDVML